MLPSPPVSLGTPFHPRTAELCTSLSWKDWAGYHAVRSYGSCHEREYYAIRHAAALIDVTPLHKYDVRGPDAARLLSWVTVKDAERLKPGQVTYLCWCDDRGKVLDDGTLTRFDEHWFRLTAAEPWQHWLERNGRGLSVDVEDASDRVAALAVQGPCSRALLADACDGDVAGLRFFRSLRTRVAGLEAVVTRTGYTGDLGYEVWVANEDAVPLWDALVAAGRPHGALPCGLDALDVSRIEAGFVLEGVDYSSARTALSEERCTTPYELGLGWTVQLDREPFLGQAALREEARRGSRRATVALDLDWEDLERLHEARGVPPALPATAWRGAEPVYGAGRWVGRATSGTWSPTLKRYLAIALVEADSAAPGTELEMEVVVEFRRERVRARVVERPTYDPPRKRSTPGAEAKALAGGAR